MKTVTKFCAICKKPPQEKFDPFCSQKCKTVDLHRWFQGVYAIPTQEKPADEQDAKFHED